MAEQVLPEPEWQRRRAAHERRVQRWTRPHVRRRALGEKHPVLDFLFTYYSHRPAHLERWHPGAGVVLAGPAAREYLRWKEYAEVDGGVAVRPELPENRARTARFIRDLLAATAARPPRLSCFGLHEWAMVYRLPAERVRHSAWPLRLGQDGTDAVVESQRITCAHYDAFRFFTPQARPLNLLSPTREDQVANEQPGCLHAGMDLFKWAYKLDPYTPSELVADCFDLALDIRELDMRASPYDLSALGYEPVRIETPEGRVRYARLQAEFAERAAPLRKQLIEVCDLLLG
ncbi:3-methyladenine DNA glycosylase [Actinokineospora bangkokensis]|uniref:3-methyladenine DNA glycosylase n=1 Tax=Actinokineospora bangkokensis TaxID=1193682 RepID=A0A1Q9LR91_9PSEU|nr:3-methyladenine DNA glycosylase [Actinokineospora bangkokensis]OLR94540.1 3-methyladenine DNA glycosylase [Actinokineospora bangkokensis]